MMHPPPKPSSVGQCDGGAVEPTQERLTWIAELVGCPVETFAGSDESDIAELLALWFAIENPDNRGKILAYARQIAGN